MNPLGRGQSHSRKTAPNVPTFAPQDDLRTRVGELPNGARPHVKIEREPRGRFAQLALYRRYGMKRQSGGIFTVIRAPILSPTSLGPGGTSFRVFLRRFHLKDIFTALSGFVLQVTTRFWT